MVSPDMIPKLKIIVAVLTALIIICLGLLVYGLATRDTGPKPADPGIAKQVIDQQRKRREQQMQRFRDGPPRQQQPETQTP